MFDGGAGTYAGQVGSDAGRYGVIDVAIVDGTLKLVGQNANIKLVGCVGYYLLGSRAVYRTPGVAGVLDRAFVLDGGDVAGVALLGHGLEHAAHDFAAARLGQHVDEVQVADHRDRPNSRRTVATNSWRRARAKARGPA